MYVAFFFFVLVIEVSSVDNLLDQFESASEEVVKTADDPKRTAQIMAAVNNHFSSSTRSFPAGRVPKIGKMKKYSKVFGNINVEHKCSILKPRSELIDTIGLS